MFLALFTAELVGWSLLVRRVFDIYWEKCRLYDDLGFTAAPRVRHILEVAVFFAEFAANRVEGVGNYWVFEFILHQLLIITF